MLIQSVKRKNVVGAPDRHAASIMSGNFIVGQQEGGGVVQRRVVNQNESRDLGNTNTNIVLTNRTEVLIKMQPLPLDSRTKRGITSASAARKIIGNQWFEFCDISPYKSVKRFQAGCVLQTGAGLCSWLAFCASWRDLKHPSSWSSVALLSETQRGAAPSFRTAAAPLSSPWQEPGISITL